MRRIILATLTAASFALLIAACTTTPEEPAPVVGAEEARQPSDRKPGAQPQPVLRAPMASPASMPKRSSDTLSKRSIYYDYDRFDIKDEYRGVVEAHAKQLREDPKAKIVIRGHADERGSREYNIALGQRRSESVKNMLLLLGVKESQVESVSLGEEKPVCTEAAEDCWWKNRRGDIGYPGEY